MNKNNMPDGLIDIYDENNELIGETKLISQAHDDGSWHRAVHVWIYNSKGEILLQLRAKGKRLYPDVWDVSVAGHVDAGEEPIISAVRETREEVGLNLEPSDLKFIVIKKIQMVNKKLINNEFAYVYLYKFDGDIGQLKIEKKELQEIKFFSTEEIKTELKNQPEKFVPHKDYWNWIIGEVKKTNNSTVKK